MTGRAYTRITRGEAVVGNGSVERWFSVFPGHTQSLRQIIAGKGYVEWIDRPQPDWGLPSEGSAVPDVPAIPEWSEACDETGATLLAEWNTPDLTVQTWCMAFHDLPVLARGVTVRSPGPTVPNRLTVERLALRRDGAGVLDASLTGRCTSGHWREKRAAAELHGAGGVGLLLATESDALFDLFETDQALIQIELDLIPRASDTADPGPVLYMIPYSGPPLAAVGFLEEAMRRLRARAAARQQRAGEQSA